MNRFEYLEVTTLEMAGKLAAEKGAAVRAGGVDVQDLLKEHLIEPASVVSIRNVPNLQEIKAGENISIGPRVTLAQLAADRAVASKARAIAISAGEAASPQIRNQATCAGNLLQRPRCWYFRNEELLCARKGGPECLAHDGENQYHAIFGNKNCAIVHPSNLAPALIAFDATVKTVKVGGARREISVAALFVTPETDIHKEHVLEPGEMMESIEVPAAALAGGAKSAFAVVREKQTYDWPLLCAAVKLTMDGKNIKDARIVLGAVCPVPLRRENAEKLLIGKSLDESAARVAATAAFDGATPLAQNGYKVPMGIAMLMRAILEAGGLS
ncbi:MAG: FAD binding domain-containing protein [Planctomycetes bacterium]|nr:FAD binding domain-containing protein [Planctomycetota bacterium]